MAWKESKLNNYPEIILSDCKIFSILVEGINITINFKDSGFIKYDDKTKKYYRTDGGQIVIEECSIDDISIKQIRMQQLNEGLYFETMYEIEPKEFLENINNGKWRLEIVEEYYSTNGGFYTGKIRTGEANFWCQIKLYFKNLNYLWNDIRYDRPF